MRFKLEDVDATAFWAKVIVGPECWSWTGYHEPRGYARISLRADNKYGKISESAYRVAWALKNGVIPDGMHLLHSCDNPGCVRPDHVRLGTHTDNMADMRLRGRADRTKKLRGSALPHAKLNEQAVREIKRMAALPAKVVAKTFRVSPATIHFIRRGETWRHVQ